MIKNNFLKANPNVYNNSKVSNIDLYNNKAKRKSFELTWHRIGRKLITNANKNNKNYILCSVSYKKMELYNNYPLCHGILIFSETRPKEIYSIPLLIKKSVYYIIPISYQVLIGFVPNFQEKFIPGRLYNKKVFTKNILNTYTNNNISNTIMSFFIKYHAANKINNFIKKWLDTKKSILNHDLIEDSVVDNQESSRCTIC